ncbi:MAG: helix-turn-helix domain-containing protein [Nostocales cyanobacterium]|nr:MAG: helix-turn-helix domain-containing protein [Nostocales cyanobacterium]TAF12347.1 MAG: helix-turn-helix domain-containing protein [Nostocales cyanobacterium]
MKWLKKKAERSNKLSLEQQQSQKLAHLGAKLSDLRQQQGLSLDEVVVKTRIPRRLLNAIEAGDMEYLPEPIYTQGLIRQFADALGLRGIDFASDFPVGFQRVSIPRNKLSEPFLQLRPIHLYLLYIFVIVCSVNGLSQLLNKTEMQADQTQDQFKVQLNSEVISQKLPEPDFQKINAEVVKIDLTFESSSWIRVITDGETKFEGFLPQGSQRNWQASEELTLITDNAGGVLMSVNQDQPRKMGELGEVAKIRIANKVKS